MAALYGFHNLADILGQRVTAVDYQIINDAVQQSVDAHNADLSATLSLFVTNVQDEGVGYRPLGENELQDVDEWGRPDPVRFPAPVARYFPIQMAQTSIALNYVTTQKMTVQELQERLTQMFVADARWMRRKLLSSLFTNTAYNFVDPIKGTISISPLANGDSETYLRVGSGTASTDTHHKGAAALDAAVLTDVRNELIEHSENGGDTAQVVVFVPTASKATVQGLAGFVAAPDPNITLGTGVDQYTGSFAANAPGTVIGYDADAQVHLREWARLPNDYIVGITDAAQKPIAIREDAEASLRGFGEIPERQDTPYLQRIWSRRAGFGAYNRVGAVVYRTNNATYAIPTGYAAPA